MRTGLSLFLVAIAVITGCKKESSNYIPDKVSATSVDNAWRDSTQPTIAFFPFKPQGVRTRRSGDTIDLIFDSVYLYCAPWTMHSAYLSQIRFDFIGINNEKCDVDFSDFKLFIVRDRRLVQIASKAEDAIGITGLHYVSFHYLEDRIHIPFSNLYPQAIKLTGVIKGKRGDTFRARIALITTKFVTSTGFANITGLPFICPFDTRIE